MTKDVKVVIDNIAVKLTNLSFSIDLTISKGNKIIPIPHIHNYRLK